jgi:hypothetical protein
VDQVHVRTVGRDWWWSARLKVNWPKAEDRQPPVIRLRYGSSNASPLPLELLGSLDEELTLLCEIGLLNREKAGVIVVVGGGVRTKLLSRAKTKPLSGLSNTPPDVGAVGPAVAGGGGPQDPPRPAMH